MSDVELTDSEITIQAVNQTSSEVHQGSELQSSKSSVIQLNDHRYVKEGDNVTAASNSLKSPLSNLVTPNVSSYVTLTEDCVNLTFSFPKSSFGQMSLDVLKHLAGIGLNSTGSNVEKLKSNDPQKSATNGNAISDSPKDAEQIVSRNALNKSLSDITSRNDVYNSEVILSSYEIESNDSQSSGKEKDVHELECSQKLGYDSEIIEADSENNVERNCSTDAEVSGKNNGNAECSAVGNAFVNEHEGDVSTSSVTENSVAKDSNEALRLHSKNIIEHKVKWCQSLSIEFDRETFECTSNDSEISDAVLCIPAPSVKSEPGIPAQYEPKEGQDLALDKSEAPSDINSSSCLKRDNAIGDISGVDTSHGLLYNTRSNELTDTYIKLPKTVEDEDIEDDSITHKIHPKFETVGEVVTLSEVEVGTSSERDAMRVDCPDGEATTENKSEPREITETNNLVSNGDSLSKQHSVSSKECIELGNVWPEILPFTEIKVIQTEEIKSHITPGAVSKHFKLQLSEKCIVVNVISKGTRDIGIEVAEYIEDNALSNVAESSFVSCTANELTTVDNQELPKGDSSSKSCNFFSEADEICNIPLADTSEVHSDKAKLPAGRIENKCKLEEISTEINERKSETDPLDTNGGKKESTESNVKQTSSKCYNAENISQQHGDLQQDGSFEKSSKLYAPENHGCETSNAESDSNETKAFEEVISEDEQLDSNSVFKQKTRATDKNKPQEHFKLVGSTSDIQDEVSKICINEVINEKTYSVGGTIDSYQTDLSGKEISNRKVYSDECTEDQKNLSCEISQLPEAVSIQSPQQPKENVDCDTIENELENGVPSDGIMNDEKSEPSDTLPTKSMECASHDLPTDEDNSRLPHDFTEEAVQNVSQTMSDRKSVSIVSTETKDEDSITEQFEEDNGDGSSKILTQGADKGSSKEHDSQKETLGYSEAHSTACNELTSTDDATNKTSEKNDTPDAGDGGLMLEQANRDSADDKLSGEHNSGIGMLVEQLKIAINVIADTESDYFEISPSKSSPTGAADNSPVLATCSTVADSEDNSPVMKPSSVVASDVNLSALTSPSSVSVSEDALDVKSASPVNDSENNSPLMKPSSSVVASDVNLSALKSPSPVSVSEDASDVKSASPVNDSEDNSSLMKPSSSVVASDVNFSALKSPSSVSVSEDALDVKPASPVTDSEDNPPLMKPSSSVVASDVNLSALKSPSSVSVSEDDLVVMKPSPAAAFDGDLSVIKSPSSTAASESVTAVTKPSPSERASSVMQFSPLAAGSESNDCENGLSVESSAADSSVMSEAPSEYIIIDEYVLKNEELPDSYTTSNRRTLKVSCKETNEDALSEGDKECDDCQSIDNIGESDDSNKDHEEIPKYMKARKRFVRNAKHKTDEVDAAPTRARTKNRPPNLSKDVIPENTVVSKYQKSGTKLLFNPSVGRTSPPKRFLRSQQSQETSPNQTLSGRKASVKPDASEKSELTAETEAISRKKRAETPLKKDLMVPSRSSPRKVRRPPPYQTSEARGESGETPKKQRSSDQGNPENQSTKAHSSTSTSIYARKSKRVSK